MSREMSKKKVFIFFFVQQFQYVAVVDERHTKYDS
jgi:hypothetical protein